MNLRARDPKRYRIKGSCALFGKTKQAFYKYDEELHLACAAERSFAVEYAREIRQQDPGMGMDKIWHMYKAKFSCERNVLGRDAFCTLLAEEGMKIRMKRRRAKTTDSSHGLPVYPNLTKDFIPDAPDQLWVSDITYIEIMLPGNRYIFCYLSLILDAYSKEIVGWSVGNTLKTIYPLEALRMALKRIEGKQTRLIHHSDRGIQYASSEYTALLNRHGITISMTECGDPKDNAQAERINNTMKNELLRGKTFYSITEVADNVDSAVEFYNNSRPHMSLDMHTPAEASRMRGPIRRRWNSFRENAINMAREGKNE